MFGSHLPFSALHAFESSARHLSFKQAAHELHVTAGAVSQQVRLLEERREEFKALEVDIDSIESRTNI